MHIVAYCCIMKESTFPAVCLCVTTLTSTLQVKVKVTRKPQCSYLVCSHQIMNTNMKDCL